MRHRSLIFLLLLALGCMFLGLLVYISADRHSLTLADLTPRDSRSAGSGPNINTLTQALGKDGAWAGDLDWNIVFYTLAALIVTLLALRVIVSAVRIATSDVPLRPPRSTAYDYTPISDRAADYPTARALRLVAPTEPAAEFNEPVPAPTEGRARGTGFFFAELSAHFRSYARGLTGKMMVTFTGIVAAFGLLTAVLVHLTFTASLWGHAIKRAKITAVNVSDSAPGYVLTNQSSGLREILRNYASKPGVAYVLVQNRAGKILAHSFPVLPLEVQSDLPVGSLRDDSQRTFRLGDGIVHEVAVPLLEGQLGAVRVGIWKEDVDREIGATVAPLINRILLIVIGGVLAAILLVWNITQPIVSLVRAAREISHGELDTPAPGVTDASEYGELSRALERMRASVRAAMIHLINER